MRETDYNRYFACGWSDVKDDLLQTLDEASAAAATAGIEMTGHVKLADGVYQTTFANGIRVVVNYTKQAYTGSGVHVDAENYEMCIRDSVYTINQEITGKRKEFGLPYVDQTRGGETP